MSFSFFCFMLLGIATSAYGAMFLWFGYCALFIRDIVYAQFSIELLPKVTLLFALGLLANGIILVADLTGHFTIWWPDVPVI